MEDKKDFYKKFEKELEKEIDIVNTIISKKTTDSDWFIEVVKKIYELGLSKVDLNLLKKEYNTNDKFELAEKVINTQSKISASIGLASSGLFTTSQISLLFSGGTSLIAGTSLATAEMIYLLKQQINLVNTITEIFGKKLNKDNPDDLFLILALGLGIKGNDFIKLGIANISVKIAQKISSETIKKYSLPFINIATSSTFNYLSTRAIGNTAVKYFRKNTSIENMFIDKTLELLNDLNIESIKEPSIFEKIIMSKELE